MTDREILRRLVAGESLARREMTALFGRLMDGELSEAAQAGILVALAAKGESVEEITGAAEALRARVVAVPHHLDDLVDTCGTGGDGLRTFNISTAAALVAAAGGARVAKHGNRSVSSRCGSADVLEALGVEIEMSPAAAGRALETVGIAFLFAPGFHPAMRRVMPVRRALGIRTLFNLIGPLTNPAGARRQLMGVYARDLAEPVGEVLRRLGCEHALVVHGEDGQDEISVTGPTRIVEVRPDGIDVTDARPEDFGLERSPLAALRGGGPRANAAAMRELLAGAGGPLADAVGLNAGAALYVAGRAASVRAGLDLARRLLADGSARAKLDQLTAAGATGRPRND